MSGLVCAMCAANLGPEDARLAATILGGIAVCLDPADEDGTGVHFDAAWALLSSKQRERIANADGLSVINSGGLS